MSPKEYLIEYLSVLSLRLKLILLRYYYRIHAEFQLNDVPGFPFWFTPGQFAGNIILSKDASHVREFHLYVPNDKSVFPPLFLTAHTFKVLSVGLRNYS